MRLTEIEGELIALITPKGWLRVDMLEDASGVMFLCPGCFAKNGGTVGTHSVVCWFAGRGVPDDMKLAPGRWNATGTTIADLTLMPNIDVGAERCWHGFVRNGEVTNA